MPLKVLVIGVGICGPAFATMLRRSDPGHSITVIERYPTIRHNGLQLDLRSWGVPIIKRLGLEGAVRAKGVQEAGLAFVNSAGRVLGAFGIADSSSGSLSFTTEFEIMRGDLVQILYDASLEGQAALDAEERGKKSGPGGGGAGDEDHYYPPGVHYEFGKTVARLDQDDGGVDVVFSDGAARRYDLVVGADGQWSRTRRMLFGEEAAAAAFKPMHVYAAYFQVPRVSFPRFGGGGGGAADDDDDDDDALARFYQPGGGRAVMLRTGNRAQTQVYLMVRTAADATRRAIERQPAAAQKDVFAAQFRGAGWCVDELLAQMPGADDFYAEVIGQVRAPRATRGRVALLGDAAHCASPLSGMGTTVSLTGAYVLAGEIARHRGDPAAVPAALDAYDAVVKPYVADVQNIVAGVPHILCPGSWWFLTLLRLFVRFAYLVRLDHWLSRLSPEKKGGRQLPEYPELNLAPPTPAAAHSS
ncbi:FAD/NAD(P)-binding domain-containing protein [Durotheca rogersii]|uniref:FAD/NAD(P)-binding domain-containing protein n=1 Tax=Durotheca rogersii TaxID=419775 RepID=UPI00221E5C20|nr:FAD/NAD(P)-binding domain-containing protein [Durotheca rogersii]KAI5866062.1 FAD/NAD(P)-binding domain-containing protein [Durotheca rogersii]